MKRITVFYILIIIFAVLGCIFYYEKGSIGLQSDVDNPTSAINSFEDCIQAGHAVINGNPRQCKDGQKIFAEELRVEPKYINASSGLIVVDLPKPGAVTGKEFSITGKARGTWYFEASFPVQVIDTKGKVIAQAVARAKGDWMTENFVPYTVNIKIPSTYIGKATLILKKDNPSGMKEYDASLLIPITIEY